MRVLVTGHRGYIGAILVPMLRQTGHEVAGLDSDLYADCTFKQDSAGVPELADIPELRKDVRDITAEDVCGYDAVIHLAGLSNDPLGDLNPALTYEINYRASVRLAELAKQAGVRRFLFSSSCSNYGAAGDGWIDEQAAFNPVTPYGRSKVLAEQGISLLADEAFCPTFLRNATAYGVSPRIRFDLVLNNLVAWATATGEILLKSDGTPWRPIVHIEDISRAFIAVLQATEERVCGRAFNVGSNEDNYRIRELAEIVRETVTGSRITYAEGAGPDKRCYRVNCARLPREIPAFAPRWNARAGAAELYRALHGAGITPDLFEGPRFKRIEHIKMLLSRGLLDATLRWNVRVEAPHPEHAAG